MQMNRTIARRASTRQAMTLVELLLVVTIIGLLMAITVPTLRPAIQEGHLREASRQFNAYCAGAKSRAASLGREVGIQIHRTVPGSNASLQAIMVEVPSPYSGDTTDARSYIRWDRTDGRYELLFTNSGSLTSTASTALVKPGESFLIKFDFKGRTYRGFRDSNNGDFCILGITSTPIGFYLTGPDGAWGRAGVDDDNSMVIDDYSEAGAANSDDLAPGLPFCIYLEPRPSSANPLQLAGGACFDLQYSGMGAIGTEFAAVNLAGSPDSTPITFMFNPSGDVSRVYARSLSGAQYPSGPLHFMIGRLSQADTGADGATINVANVDDSSCLWVSITDRGGYVTTAENDGLAGGDLLQARQFARAGQTMGGK